MRKTREILRLKWQHGRSHREIARALAVGVGTPSDVAKRALAAGLTTWNAIAALSEAALDRKLYAEQPRSPATARPKPDPATLHIELRKPGVTLRLLHEEYATANPNGYGYTQFVAHYNTWADRQKVVMLRSTRPARMLRRLRRQEAEDRRSETGERIEVELFVAVMGASNYTYAEVTATQQSADWIASHNRLVEYLGGAPGAFVPDQLKSGVTTAAGTSPRPTHVRGVVAALLDDDPAGTPSEPARQGEGRGRRSDRRALDPGPPAQRHVLLDRRTERANPRAPRRSERPGDEALRKSAAALDGSIDRSRALPTSFPSRWALAPSGSTITSGRSHDTRCVRWRGDYRRAPLRSRTARGPRGSLRHQVHNRDEPGAAAEVASTHLRAHACGRDLRPPDPQCPQARAKGSVQAQGPGGRNRE